ncbi:UNVERIFIED_ORG: xanthine/CO dehydrogenase XdhC/CoxF family maturation factor [Pseudomonas reinekei]|uniref:XdhC family protein n=1 Tax=Pseudomonas laurylsulfatiphila TaxID=2011015 RepID=UPI003D1921DD|nr:xanthine/CO dehydrogenase XdhC/CoxF family maturation factor [Pseudomonas reinekei]MDF9907230.1 xanthine/CO dehydrogenase XdhC/CoxF family maturation factor [Pseudomonas reinekei]
MSGLNDLLQAIDFAAQAGEETILATVVKVEGSAYRRSGARMLIPLHGRTIGTVSGGCLEQDLAKKAWWLTDSGEPVVRRYSTGATEDEDDEQSSLTFGLGCNGTVFVLLERLRAKPSSPVIELLRRVRDSQQPAAMATVIGTSRNASARVGDRLLSDTDGTLRNLPLKIAIRHDLRKTLAQKKSSIRLYTDARGEVEVFFEYIAPPPRLVIFGAGHDAQPLVRMAKLLNWHVSVIDSRSHFARPERFPQADAVIFASLDNPFDLRPLTDGAAVTVMTHSYRQDLHWLGQLLQTSPAYLGQLGPKERTQRLLAEIGQGTCALHFPMGLDLGGDAPENVALSILAEMTAVMNQRQGGMLRHRRKPIHQADLQVSEHLHGRVVV